MCGVWENALSWAICETSAGFYGLLLASEKEKHLIFQLWENIRFYSNREFGEFLHNGWGHLVGKLEQNSIPGYENHLPAAEDIYKSLPRKIIQRESTFVEGKGREMHFEVGITNTFRYFYWANTFDQRQLVLIDESGAEMLHEYYRESLETAQISS